MSKKRSTQRSNPSDPRPPVGRLRIIGGQFRGRLLEYSGDPRTRPMKDRVRQAVFNLLADSIAGKEAIDLFAGTGALGLEAISRGASRATLIERHFPTAQLIRQNVTQLGVEAQVEVVAADSFFWVRRQWTPAAGPVVVFCSPPYDFYIERRDEMLEMLSALVARSGAGSTLVIEADDRFGLDQLPQSLIWDIRRYAPAVIAIAHLTVQTPRSE